MQDKDVDKTKQWQKDEKSHLKIEVGIYTYYI